MTRGRLTFYKNRLNRSNKANRIVRVSVQVQYGSHMSEGPLFLFLCT